MKDIPLDLSALAYPMMRTKRSESNYRFVAELTTPADPRILTESLSGVLPLYPVFRTRVAPSFFWHVLRPHDAPLVVKEDDRPPLVPMRKEDTHGYPFRLAYREKEIIFEVFHAVTDANVAALFLTDLLTRYAEIIEGTEPTEIPTRDLLPEDAFLQCGRKKKLRDISLNQYNGESVYSLGERGEYRDAPETLSLEIPLSTLLENARGHDATITEYIAAAYITAILEQETLPLRKSLCLFIPIDLRRYCPSHTMQNFVCFERIYLEKGESDLSFDHILAVVHEQFLAKITPENMQDHVDDVRRCFTLPLLKYTPLFLKQPLFKLAKCLMNKVRQTAILSNIGTITLPERAKGAVRNVKFFLNIGKNAPLNLAIVTYEGICNIDLTNGLARREIPDRFFALLQDQGRK